MVKHISVESGSEDVDAYIAKCPKEVRSRLKVIRAAIKDVAPDATETTSYFRIPGYSYPGYDYNGMFAWFGLQKSYIQLLVRPPAIQLHKSQLRGYVTTKAAVHLPLDEKVPATLIKELVKASLVIMKSTPKKGRPRPQT